MSIEFGRKKQEDPDLDRKIRKNHEQGRTITPGGFRKMAPPISLRYRNLLYFADSVVIRGEVDEYILESRTGHVSGVDTENHNNLLVTMDKPPINDRNEDYDQVLSVPIDQIRRLRKMSPSSSRYVRGNQTYLSEVGHKLGYK